MTELGVNIDHIATIRQARMTFEPDPIALAFLAEMNGADQITVHLREDRRHIQDRDLRILRNTVQTRLNLEMAPTAEMVAIAKSVHPDSVTLVPEKRKELTTEGGLNLNIKNLEHIIKELKEANIIVSLFIAPDIGTIKQSKKLGSDTVEIHTGYFANAKTDIERQRELERIRNAVKNIKNLKMRAAAGHGITYYNVHFLTNIGIEEFNIGHSIIARAVVVGFAQAVRDMKKLINMHYQ